MPILLAESPWNSLEIIKLIVGTLSPITILILGFVVNRRLQNFEHRQWTNQQVVQKRLDVFDTFAPMLNDLLCYMTYIGAWKELEPPEAVRLKRKLDRIAYVNAPLFPPDFLKYYNRFMETCYSTFAGWGKDAQLRTGVEKRREARGEQWQAAWDECFAPADTASKPEDVRAAYTEFMSFFAESLGIGVKLHQPMGRTPKEE